MTPRAHEKGAVGAPLPDGRMHFQHGPIDLVLDCDGPPGVRAAAFDRAWDAFTGVLPALVAELAALRSPVRRRLSGPVARRMRAAALPHGTGRDAVFVTPMAAVAGAVADHVLAAMVSGAPIARAHVNNGGDIALHLAPGQRYRTGIVFDVDAPALDGLGTIDAASPVRGVATSGWRGRSRSLGIADSVTVLAPTAAAGDVAATLIANACNAVHPAIERVPASALDPDSDLGDRPVTVAVGTLDEGTVAAALDGAARAAGRMRDRGLITAALITLRGRTRMVDAAPQQQPRAPISAAA